MGRLRALLFVLVLGTVPLHAAEKVASPAELKTEIEAVSRESAALEAENAQLREKLSELEQKTRELASQLTASEAAPAEAAAPAQPAPHTGVQPPPDPLPEQSFLDTLLADPMMLGVVAGAMVLLGVLMIVMRRRRR